MKTVFGFMVGVMIIAAGSLGYGIYRAFKALVSVMHCGGFIV